MEQSLKRLFIKLSVLGIFWSLYPVPVFAQSCDLYFGSHISSNEVKTINRLKEAKASFEPSVGNVRTVYRGFHGSFSNFRPMAHSYRDGYDELYLAADQKTAASYAIVDRDKAGRAHGYLLELQIPRKFMKNNKVERVRLSQFLDRDLTPFISRVGVIDFNYNEIIKKFLVRDIHETEKIEYSVSRLISLKNPWAIDKKQDFKRAHYRISEQDLNDLNYMIEKYFVEDEIAKGNPAMITWISF